MIYKKSLSAFVVFLLSIAGGQGAMSSPFPHKETGKACNHYLLQHFHICHPEDNTVWGRVDPEMVTFPYQDNRIYIVYTHAGMMTDISFPFGESIQGIFLSDNVRWIHAISQSKEDIFFKPTQSDLLNPITVITNHRRYHIWLVSVENDHLWYHRVSWVVPPETPDLLFEKKKNRATESVGIQNMNFNYTISSNHSSLSFYPTAVFDDGIHMWIRMPDHIVHWPVLFSLDDQGHFLVEEYVIQGFYFKMAHKRRCVVLKLDEELVKICQKTPFSFKKWFHNMTHFSFLRHRF